MMARMFFGRGVVNHFGGWKRVGSAQRGWGGCAENVDRVSGRMRAITYPEKKMTEDLMYIARWGLLSK